MTYVRRGSRKAVNRLLGILGVASVWTTAPTNLGRCTDGNWMNMTGEGSKNIAAWAEAGRIDFDMGAIYNVIVNAKLRIRNNDAAGSDVIVWLQSSEDGITYTQFYCGAVGDQFWKLTVTNTFYDGLLQGFAHGRYIRLTWFASTNACTVSGAVWEIQAIHLGL